LDFGLAREFRENGTHKASRRARFEGTLFYASLYTHEGQYQSRRDDMESLAYSILMLYNRGTLPWNIEEGKEKDEASKTIVY
jgi:serine/threonine protein kinase